MAKFTDKERLDFLQIISDKSGELGWRLEHDAKKNIWCFRGSPEDDDGARDVRVAIDCEMLFFNFLAIVKDKTGHLKEIK